MKTNIKTEKRARLHKKISSRVSGTAERPRLAVFRSNRYMYAQLIDDQKGITVVSASDLSLDDKMNKVERAKTVGKTLAENAKKADLLQKCIRPRRILLSRTSTGTC
jgi:large subunit ribosomal protein L18